MQFSCQMTDVQSSGNDERLKFRVENTSERIPHRSSTSKRELLSLVARTSAYESVAQEHCGVPKWYRRFSKYQTPRQPRSLRRPNTNLNNTRLCCRRPRNQHCYYRRRAVGQQRKIPNLRTWRRSRTSPRPQDIKETIQFKHIDPEQVDEKQQAALRAKFKENLAKQNAESKKRSTMHETSAAEEQQNRAESILEHQTEFEVEFHIEEERLQRSRTRFKR